MSAMTQPKTRTPPIGPSRSSWRGLMPLIAVVVVTVVGLGGWLLLRDGDRTPTDVVQDIASGIRNDDVALLEEVSGTDVLWFYEWQIALRAEPEFTDCTETAVGDSGTTRVACTVTTGNDFFYTQVAGEPFTTTIKGIVRADGTFYGTEYPPPRGETTDLVTIEAELRQWVQDAYPDLEDDLYGSPGYIGLKMTRESGELRMDLLDEFVGSRE